MTRRSSRVLAAVVALGLVAGACGGDTDDGVEAADPPASTTTTVATATGSGTTDETTTTAPAEEPAGLIEIEIAGGNVVGGVRREKVEQGSKVTLRITSDVADELHVHTYDVTVDLVPGTPAELAFEATIPGIHEIELEQRHKKVLELEVSA